MAEFVNTNQLPAWWDLYLSPAHQTVTDIINNSADADLKADILAHTWKSFGLITQFQVSHIIGDETEKEALNCGVGVYATETELNQDVTTTLLELNNLDIFKDLIGGDRGTVDNGDDVTEILKYTNGKINMPMNAVLFVSCPYKIEDAAYPDMNYARDIIVASKQVFSGELIERYVLGSETFEWSEVTLSGKKAGKYAKLVVRGATLNDVEAVVTQ
jgi:hypothetical protein